MKNKIKLNHIRFVIKAFILLKIVRESHIYSYFIIINFYRGLRYNLVNMNSNLLFFLSHLKNMNISFLFLIFHLAP